MWYMELPPPPPPGLEETPMGMFPPKKPPALRVWNEDGNANEDPFGSTLAAISCLIWDGSEETSLGLNSEPRFGMKSLIDFLEKCCRDVQFLNHESTIC